MLWEILIIGVTAFYSVYGQSNLASNALVLHDEQYFTDLFHVVMLDVEKQDWSNLKIETLTQNLDENLPNLKVTGKATYSNGFVVAIQKIDLTEVTSGAFSSSAYVDGVLHFMDLKAGFDVLVDLGNEGLHKYTATFLHKEISMQVRITKNYETNKMTTFVAVLNVSGGEEGIKFMPKDHISQAISRNYKSNHIFDSVDQWGNNVIAPAMLKAAEKIEFPTVCLSCKS